MTVRDTTSSAKETLSSTVRLNTIVDGDVPGPVTTVTMGGDIRYLNPAARELSSGSTTPVSDTEPGLKPRRLRARLGAKTAAPRQSASGSRVEARTNGKESRLFFLVRRRTRCQSR